MTYRIQILEAGDDFPIGKLQKLLEEHARSTGAKLEWQDTQVPQGTSVRFVPNVYQPIKGAA